MRQDKERRGEAAREAGAAKVGRKVNLGNLAGAAVWLWVWGRAVGLGGRREQGRRGGGLQAQALAAEAARVHGVLLALGPPPRYGCRPAHGRQHRALHAPH